MFCIQPADKLRDDSELRAHEAASTPTKKQAGDPFPYILEVGSTSNSDISSRWSYKGCFQDNPSRILRGATENYQLQWQVDSVKCFQHCEANGYAYAGTEYGKECWCGTSLHSNAPLLPETTCSMPCLGKSDEICGGSWAMSVYVRSGSHTQQHRYGSLAELVAWEQR